MDLVSNLIVCKTVPHFRVNEWMNDHGAGFWTWKIHFEIQFVSIPTSLSEIKKKNPGRKLLLGISKIPECRWMDGWIFCFLFGFLFFVFFFVFEWWCKDGNSGTAELRAEMDVLNHTAKSTLSVLSQPSMALDGATSGCCRMLFTLTRDGKPEGTRWLLLFKTDLLPCASCSCSSGGTRSAGLRNRKNCDRVWPIPAVVGSGLGLVGCTSLTAFWTYGMGLMIRPEESGSSDTAASAGRLDVSWIDGGWAGCDGWIDRLTRSLPTTENSSSATVIVLRSWQGLWPWCGWRARGEGGHTTVQFFFNTSSTTSSILTPALHPITKRYFKQPVTQLMESKK